MSVTFSGPLCDDLADTCLHDGDAATDAGGKRRVEGRANGRNAVASALDDRVHLCMHDQVILHGSLESLRQVFNSTWEPIEARRDDLLRGRDNHTAHAPRGVFAPPRDDAGKLKEPEVPFCG